MGPTLWRRFENLRCSLGRAKGSRKTAAGPSFRILQQGTDYSCLYTSSRRHARPMNHWLHALAPLRLLVPLSDSSRPGASMSHATFSLTIHAALQRPPASPPTEVFAAATRRNQPLLFFASPPRIPPEALGPSPCRPAWPPPYPEVDRLVPPSAGAIFWTRLASCPARLFAGPGRPRPRPRTRCRLLTRPLRRLPPRSWPGWSSSCPPAAIRPARGPTDRRPLLLPD